MNRSLLAWTLSVLLVLLACQPQPVDQVESRDPLPSWNDGSTKTAIIDFVEDVTNDQSDNFVPIPDRIATFDNDGNLVVGTALYFQLFFAMDRLGPWHLTIRNGRKRSLSNQCWRITSVEYLPQEKKALLSWSCQRTLGLRTRNFRP